MILSARCLLFIGGIFLFLGAFVGCAHLRSNPKSMSHVPPLPTVAKVDLERFMGDWYVQGIIPWFFERGNVGTMDIYERLPDGRIAVTYAYRKGSLSAPLRKLRAVAHVYNKETQAEWRVQFFWPIAVPFLIVDLDPSYQTTVIGHPSRNFVWIMSRQPILDDASYQAILKRLADLHYDISRIERIPQLSSPSK